MLSGETAIQNEHKKYTVKKASPIYEPTGEKPPLNELANIENYKKLIEEIEKSALSDNEKDFLKLAASRFIEFNFEKIANFYANSANKELQELFEKQALVIVDFDKAIKNAYLKFDDESKKLFGVEDET